MKKAFILIFAGTTATYIDSCPKVTCSEENFATDDPDNDWCVRVNVDEEDPKRTTVTIRECLGNVKQFCEWGVPGFHETFAWPFKP